MNIQEQSVKCNEKLLARAEEKNIDISTLPSIEITKFCRMIVMFCEAEGNVTESFKKAMDVCVKNITAVEGMEEILNEFNDCQQ